MAQSAQYETRLLYQENGDLHEHDAQLIGVEPPPIESPHKPSNIIYLNETILHVQGGGQPFDLGTLTTSDSSRLNVTAVRYGTNGIEHHVDLPSPAPSLAPGTQLHITLDASRRLLNSRLHSAGHIMDAAILSLSASGQLPPLKPTKANHHPGQASVEYEGLIEGKFKELIQKRTDEVVAESKSIIIYFWTREQCESHGIELPKKMDGADDEHLFRAIEIEGYGAYGCGGTHVKDTSGVGGIVVKKISRQKGISRVSYDVR